MLRLFVVINAHIWGFYELGRNLPGSSYISYSTAGFTTYFFFSMLSRCALPTTRLAPFNKNLNIKWGHLFIADLVWESAKIFVAICVTLSIYVVFPMRFLGVPVEMPNLPLLFSTFVIAGTFGTGFGLLLHTAKQRWAIAEATTESIMWVIFVTSGVYMPYSLLPWYIDRYYWYSPLIAVIENARRALDSTYPVEDLSLAYSGAIALTVVFLGLSFRRWERKSRPPE